MSYSLNSLKGILSGIRGIPGVKTRVLFGIKGLGFKSLRAV